MSLSEHSLSPRLKPINPQQMVLRVDVEQLIDPEHPALSGSSLDN